MRLFAESLIAHDVPIYSVIRLGISQGHWDCKENIRLTAQWVFCLKWHASYSRTLFEQVAATYSVIRRGFPPNNISSSVFKILLVILCLRTEEYMRLIAKSLFTRHTSIFSYKTRKI